MLEWNGIGAELVGLVYFLAGCKDIIACSKPPFSRELSPSPREGDKEYRSTYEECPIGHSTYLFHLCF
jgi:hypothetical protein